MWYMYRMYAGKQAVVGVVMCRGVVMCFLYCVCKGFGFCSTVV